MHRPSPFLIGSALLLTALLALSVACSRAAKSDPAALIPAKDRTLGDLSLEEKVGQLFMVHFPGAVYDGEIESLVHDYHVGGVILYDITGNIQEPGQIARLTNAIALGAARGGAPKAPFIAVDQEGFPVNRLKTGFATMPSNMAVAATGDSIYAARAADATAIQLRAVGVNMNLAPVVDVNVNPANPVIGIRSYGSDPQKVAAFGTAAVQGYGHAPLLCSAKHFPGHGDTTTDSHLGLPEITASLTRLKAVELAPFQAAIGAGVPAVMTAHVKVPALNPGAPDTPATMSKPVLTGLLRDQMGFDGLILTDSIFMGAIIDNYGAREAAVDAFMAGADVILIGADFYVRGQGEAGLKSQRQVITHFQDQARRGNIPMERIDQSVARILAAKEKYGLLPPAPGNPAPTPEMMVTPLIKQLVNEIAEKSITLVSDPHGFVPVAAGETLTLIYPEKSDILARELAKLNSHLAALPYSADFDQEKAAALAATAGKSKTVLAVTGLGKNKNLQKLLDSLAAAHPGGSGLAVAALKSPYDLALAPKGACTLATYSEQPESLAALARVVAGSLAPKGVLPVTLP